MKTRGGVEIEADFVVPATGSVHCLTDRR